MTSYALDALRKEFLSHAETAKFLGLKDEDLQQLVSDKLLRCCSVPSGAVLYFITDIRNYLFYLRSSSIVNYKTGGEPYRVYTEETPCPKEK